jgi:hypothetical protein
MAVRDADVAEAMMDALWKHPSAAALGVEGFDEDRRDVVPERGVVFVVRCGAQTFRVHVVEE